MPDGKVSIWPLRYNNYFNRVLKREKDVIDYENYLIGSPFSNIDFKPNDGITTEIVLKPIEEDNIPDYILVVDGTYLNKDIELQGWIKNHRKQKEFGFIDFNDGTYFKNMQVVYDNELSNFEEIAKIQKKTKARIHQIEKTAKEKLYRTLAA